MRKKVDPMTYNRAKLWDLFLDITHGLWELAMGDTAQVDDLLFGIVDQNV
jgi:hypothetical protein